MRVRIGLLALLLALPGAAPALAQVAAPRLTPLFIGLPAISSAFNPALDPVNPAAQMWAGSSFVGAGVTTQGHNEQANLGTVTSRGNLDTRLAQLRLMGDFVSLGATLGHTRYRLKDTLGPNDIQFDVIDTRIELALRYTDWLALGVARQASREHVRTGVPPDEDVRRTELQLPGASLHFGVLYLGYASGSEELRIEGAAGVPGVVGATERDRRSVNRTGVGLRDRGDTWGYHLEVYREEREAFQFLVTYPGYVIDEIHLSGSTVEVIAWNVLLGFEKSRTDNRQSVGGIPANFTSDAVRASIGWVPRSGMTLLATGQRGRRLTNASVGQVEALMVSVGWSF